MAKFHLFEVFGIELEYMIVDRDTLKVMPIVDELFWKMAGEYVSDIERGDIAWSNELVSHVIELKTNDPAKSLDGLSRRFTEEVTFINEVLKASNAMLLPSGAHPLFIPEHETVIWPHESSEVYDLYDQIFNCKGHGWSNLQSTHVNLPFASDAEFAELHAGLRVILPLIPALCASTPLLEGKSTGFIDTRVEYYRKNQQKIPAIGGLVVPEPVFSHKEYEEHIFTPIAKAIAPYDSKGILDKHFLNSRGAIARFDRGAIEIRVIDIQECPKADIALVDLIIASTKWLIERYKDNPIMLQQNCSTTALADILVNAAKFGSQYVVETPEFLEIFGMTQPHSLREIWKFLLDECDPNMLDDSYAVCKIVLSQGNLSERMLQRVAGDPSEAGILAMYRELATCLAENRMFIP